MPTRLVSTFLLLLLIACPLSGQKASTSGVDQWIWSRGKMMKADTPPELDTRAARLQAIHQDAQELSSLAASLQSDLQQLQKGMLAKDLEQKLKKTEKLSKKLRQEITP